MRQTKIITRQRFTLRYFHTETSLDIPNIKVWQKDYSLHFIIKYPDVKALTQMEEK